MEKEEFQRLGFNAKMEEMARNVDFEAPVREEEKRMSEGWVAGKRFRSKRDKEQS